MTIGEISRYELPCVKGDSVLFLWRPAAFAEDAFDIARSWGFTYKTEGVWLKRQPCARCRSGTQKPRLDKVAGIPCEECGDTGWRRHFGMGRILRAEHETFIVATRGRPEIRSHSERSVIDPAYDWSAWDFAIEDVVPRDPETGKSWHSAKPDSFYQLVEKLSAGPYVELFARRTREGWQQFGNQLGIHEDKDLL